MVVLSINSLSGYVFNVFLAFPGLLLAIALAAFIDEGTLLGYIVGEETADLILSFFTPGYSRCWEPFA